jgi:hypothetical protein
VLEFKRKFQRQRVITSYNPNKKSFYIITKGTALEQQMKLPRIGNAMAYTNLPQEN